MVLEEYVKVNISANNYYYYKNKGYNVIMNKPLLVKNEDLSPYCKAQEKRKCDNPECNCVSSRPHRDWLRVYQNNKQDLCRECCKKVGMERSKNNCIEKYGCPFPLQNEEVKEKIFQNNLEKTGYKTSFCNPEIQRKIQKTL